MREALSHALASVMFTLSFSERFDRNDPTQVQYLQDVEFRLAASEQAGPLQFYPILRFLPGCRQRQTWMELAKVSHRVKTFLSGKIQQQRATYSDTDTRDYVDAFTHQQRKETQNPVFNGIYAGLNIYWQNYVF